MGTSTDQQREAASMEAGGSSTHGASDEISDEPSNPDSVSQRVMPPVWESFKHKVFLSHSAAQKPFVSDVYSELGRRARFPFLDVDWESLPIGDPFERLIFDCISRCMVVVVFLSKAFFKRGKWPMLEVAAMARRKKSDKSFKIIPVFFSISPEMCTKKMTQWKSHWETLKSVDKLASSERGDDDMNRNMTININEWEEALNDIIKLGGIMGEGKTEGECCAEIVEAVCKLVPRENRWINPSDIQGRDHLLKELQEVVFPKQEQNLGLRLVGLYGVRGSGKSTLSKLLCSEASKMEFRNKVHRIRLPSSRKGFDGFQKRKKGFDGSTEGLEKLSLEHSREMLKEFTYLRDEVIDKLGKGECSEYLGTVKDKVFVVIDNVIDDSRSTELAKEILKASPFGNGSVILIISSSQDVLVKNLGIDKGECLEMPDLREDDAKALFLAKATVPPGFPKNREEESLLMDCIKRCYFSKGRSCNSCHYHPLALVALGVGLSRYGNKLEEWKTALEEIESTFNQFRSDKDKQVFAIFKNSFNSLNNDLKNLFMDAALFLPTDEGNLSRWGYPKPDLLVGLNPESGIPLFTDIEWLSMVHGKSVETTKHMLEDLKKKAIVETVDDDFGMHRPVSAFTTSIGMHDLWRDFALFQTKFHDVEERKWIFEKNVEEKQLLRKSEKALSMFLDFKRWPGARSKTLKLKDIFPCVAVLRMLTSPGPNVVLNLKGLNALKSLEVLGSRKDLNRFKLFRLRIRQKLTGKVNEGNRFNLHGLRTLQNLTFLRLWNISSSERHIQ